MPAGQLILWHSALALVWTFLSFLAYTGFTRPDRRHCHWVTESRGTRQREKWTERGAEKWVSDAWLTVTEIRKMSAAVDDVAPLLHFYRDRDTDTDRDGESSISNEIPSLVPASPANGTDASTPNQRLASLDVFRGLTVAVHQARRFWLKLLAKCESKPP